MCCRSWPVGIVPASCARGSATTDTNPALLHDASCFLIFRSMFQLKLQNGSDHAVVASYSGLYEEC